jgi:hypothetical protein
LIKTASLISAAVCAAGLIGFAGPATAAAQGRHHHHTQPPPIKVLGEGLNGPRQVSAGLGGLLVAESDTGQITLVNRHRHRTTTLVTGVPQAQGVTRAGGKIYIAAGEAEPDDDPSTPDTSTGGLYVARPGGAAHKFADLLAYELANNPDGQIQFGPDGQPLDSLSNPYFVIRDRRPSGFLLVADAGGNDVLAVDRHGRVSTFYVPPTVTTGVCATAENNTVSGVGCDPVPTGLAYGPDGLLYISALTAEAPGEGRVYVVTRSGQFVREITGFSSPTGVAVDRRGTVYVSELLEGAPEGDGPPPPGFDPSTVGQIVAVPRSGPREYAQVTMPSGLLWSHGRLYSSAWAVAAFVGISDAGQVVSVDRSAFQPN